MNINRNLVVSLMCDGPNVSMSNRAISVSDLWEWIMYLDDLHHHDLQRVDDFTALFIDWFVPGKLPNQETA